MSIRTRRKPMRAVAAAVAAAVGASLLAISAPTSVGATPDVREAPRIAGADRYATANEVALAKSRNTTAGPGVFTSMVIVSGENFPDGLAAASLAGALGAPMLLTQSAALPTSVIATITMIKARHAALANAVIVGGTSAVSADIATQLTAMGYSVTRVAGDDRYGTANAVAAATRTNNAAAIGTFGGLRTAFLASGTNFPDALAASAQAYKGKHPIFLTNGTTLSDDTKAAMTAAGVQQVIILGGTSAISAEVATAVAGVTGVIASTRVSGDTRYDTATALATTLGTVDASFKSKAFLVSGTNFPDALVASQLAGAATGGGAIIPVNTPLPAAISAWVTANQSTLATIQAIGGTEAVPAAIVTEVKTGATTAPLTATITALDGATTATIVFSGAVTETGANGAEERTNYTLQAANLTPKTISLATLSATTNTVTLEFAARLAPGDILRIVPNKILSSTTANLYVAETSVTIAANTTVPVATITAYSGATESATGTALPKVWVSFDTEVSGFSCATMLRRTAQTIGAQAETYFVADGEPVPGKVFSCKMAAGKAALTTGDTITLLAGAGSTSATTPLGNATTTTTAVADTTAPSISSATFTQSGTAATATPAKLAVGGEVTISARAGTSVGGKAGNSVQVFTVANPALAAAPTCVYTASTNTVTISAATTTSALVLANACNANTTFNTLFTAAATTAGGLTGYTNGAQAPLAGGLDLLTVTITFSEPINPATFDGTNGANGVTFGGGLTATGTGFATTATAATQLLAGGAVITATTAGTAVAGLSTVALKIATTDRNNNAAGTTGVVMTATPAS